MSKGKVYINSELARKIQNRIHEIMTTEFSDASIADYIAAVVFEITEQAINRKMPLVVVECTNSEPSYVQ